MRFCCLRSYKPGRREIKPTDASLMERILQRDSGALETLYDRYARPVYSLVLRISQQPASAEEIVQDVFLQLWRNAKRYQATRGPLEPWLFTWRGIGLSISSA